VTSKYGHHVDVYPSGVEARHRVQGPIPGRLFGGRYAPGERWPVTSCRMRNGMTPPYSRRRRKMPLWSVKARAKRGKVTKFSKKSRRRLRRLLMRVDWQFYLERGRAGWLGLSFGGSPCSSEANRARRAFFAAFERKYPGAGLIWKREFQGRGVAHFHILVVFDTRSPAGFLDWAVETWGRVTGSPCQSVHYRVVYDWPGLAKYMIDCSKESYQTVPPNWDKHPGRWWGHRNIDQYVDRPRRVWGRDVWANTRRMATRLIGGSGARRRRLHSAFIQDSDRWLAYLETVGDGQAAHSVNLERVAGRLLEFNTWAETETESGDGWLPLRKGHRRRFQSGYTLSNVGEF